MDRHLCLASRGHCVPEVKTKTHHLVTILPDTSSSTSLQCKKKTLQVDVAEVGTFQAITSRFS